MLERVEQAMVQFHAEIGMESAQRYKDGEFLSETQLKVFDRNRRGLVRSERTGRMVSPGALRKQAEYHYLKALVAIYENAVKRAGRNYKSSDYTGQSSEKLDPVLDAFVLYCFNRAGHLLEKVPRGLFKKALHELHPNARRGRPGESPRSG